MGILPTDCPCVSTVSCEEPVKNVQVLSFSPAFPLQCFFFTFVQGVSKNQVLSQLHQVKEHKCHCTALFIRELQAILHLDRAVSGLTKEFLGS